VFAVLTASAFVANSSQGSSGIGPVVMVVGLTIGSALVLSWLFGRLPGSNENTGASPFAGWRRRKDPFGSPPDDPMDRPPKSPFDP
jgi:hypothetical protein